MERPPLELGDLVEHWTLVGTERGLVAAKNYDSQLGFALLVKFYGRFGRFPRGRSELHDDAVEFVARQLGVGAGSNVQQLRSAALTSMSTTQPAHTSPLTSQFRMERSQ